MEYHNVNDIVEELQNFSKEVKKIYMSGPAKGIAEHWDSQKLESYLAESVFIMNKKAAIDEIASRFLIFSLFPSMIVTMESEKDKFELQRRLSILAKGIKSIIEELLENWTGSERYQFSYPEYRDWADRVVDCLEDIDDDCKKHGLYE